MHTRKTERPDVLVVGGGLAGLAAARELLRAGVHVTVVEAQGRLGGRVRTWHDALAPVPVELGAEFLHGDAPRTLAMSRAHHLATQSVDGERWVSGGEGGPATRMPDFDERLAHALRTIVRRARRDTSFAEAARGARLARADRELVISFVENFHAATADAIGARWIARGGAEGPGRSMRFAVGHASLVDALAGELSGSLRLGCRATRITWSRGSVRVVVSGATGHDFELAARAAIVALPLGVLRSPEEALCHVHFDPHLDAAHTDALAKLAMGDVVKVVLRFREAFWSEHGGENVAFFHSVRGPFPTFWTSAPIDSPVITAWAGGRLAQALSGIDERRLSALAVDSLADVVGQRRRHAHELFETSFFHDWRLDPFARGAYSHGLVGGATADRPAARPIEGTLFFAGEHLAGASSAGTVEGAIESGERAAREVLASHSSASSRRKAA